MKAGIYIQLFDGRENEAVPLQHGNNGPVFGPLQFVEVENGNLVKLGLEVDHYELTITPNGCVFYDGLFYSDFSVFFEPKNDGHMARHKPFDQTKAILPANVLPKPN